MNIKNTFYSFATTPFWGFIEIRCVSIEALKISNFDLFEILKREKFKPGYQKFHRDEQSKIYSESIFGNYYLESITMNNFKEVSFSNFIERFSFFIATNKKDVSVNYFDFDSFIASHTLNVKSIFTVTDSIYEFDESSELKHIMPDGIGGPFWYFNSFIGFGESKIEYANFKTIKIIQMGFD
jgi:hypothetical protein